MKLDCDICDAGIGSDGNPCAVCSGDAEIDLLDSDFPKIVARRKLQGILWNALFTQIADLTNKVDDVMNRCDDIFEKVDI